MFQLPALPPLEPRYNVAPAQDVLVVRRLPDAAARQAVRLRWGLVPSWAKDVSIGSRMINARSESVAEKPAFRGAFRERRCLIPADGFYEWRHTAKTRQPFLVRMRDGKPFGLAGLWESWESPEAERLETFTILTTSANELVGPLHDRMPVIVPPEQFDVWLDPTVRDPALLLPLLRPYPAERMSACPVSSLVNNPKNEGAACAAPLAEASASQRPKDGAQRGQQLLF